jgi:hypothetical protein
MPINIKKQLGFEKGPIILFKGDTYSHLEWFRESVAKYRKYCGWYIPSTEIIPNDIPEDLEIKTLKWEAISSDENTLLPDHIIKEVIDELLYDESSSEWVGEIGQRTTMWLLVKSIKEIDTFYGRSTIYNFEDEDGNVIVWFSTGAGIDVEEDEWYQIVGTVTKHQKYKNIKQTIINRCKLED